MAAAQRVSCGVFADGNTYQVIHISLLPSRNRYRDLRNLCRSSFINVFSSQGPKSSFITPEKRAKLRSNPVKVHFAEEVEVNGQSQVSYLRQKNEGDSSQELLFMCDMYQI